MLHRKPRNWHVCYHYPKPTGEQLALTTTPPEPEIEQYRREKSDRYYWLCQRFLKHAQEELERGDTLQASEKAYGAIAHAVKAYGEYRGWNHYNHHRVALILDQLRDEENDPSLTESYDAVESLHNNYFEYELEPTRVRDRLDTAKSLVERVENLRRSTPNPLPSATLNREQRRRLTLLMQPPTMQQLSMEDLPSLEDLPE